MNLNLFIYLIVALFGLNIKSVEATGLTNMGSIYGCSVDASSTKVSGFKGSIFYYPWISYNKTLNTGNQNHDLYLTKNYLNGGYYGTGEIIGKNHDVYTEANVIANDATATVLTYNTENVCDSTCAITETWASLSVFKNTEGDDVEVPVTNFGFHMIGYMIPSITGNHTISMGYIDDLGIINIGSGEFLSENCCNNFVESGSVYGDNTVESIWSAEGPTGVNQITADLVANVAYPISIFFVNRGNLAGISLTYTDPTGAMFSDFSGFVYHYDQIDHCQYNFEAITTIPWAETTTSSTSASYATTSVFSNSYSDSGVSTFTADVNIVSYTIYVPAPRVSSTTTQEYSGSDTTTLSSAVTTVYSDDTMESISTLYIVGTPVPTVTSTAYTTWGGSVTLTYSTEVTIYTDPSGEYTVSTIYHVETPAYISTTTIPWTGTFTTTTTTTSITTGDDGILTTATIITVETPTPTFTTTVSWTGTFTSSTTGLTTFTGTDGSSTTASVITVETPATIFTTTVPWTGTFTSSTTGLTTSTGTDGSFTTATVITVETPTTEFTTTVPSSNVPLYPATNTSSSYITFSNLSSTASTLSFTTTSTDSLTNTTCSLSSTLSLTTASTDSLTNTTCSLSSTLSLTTASTDLLTTTTSTDSLTTTTCPLSSINYSSNTINSINTITCTESEYQVSDISSSQTSTFSLSNPPFELEPTNYQTATNTNTIVCTNIACQSTSSIAPLSSQENLEIGTSALYSSALYSSALMASKSLLSDTPATVSTTAAFVTIANSSTISSTLKPLTGIPMENANMGSILRLNSILSILAMLVYLI